MTEKQFYEELKKTRGWVLRGGWLRRDDYCPLTYLAKKLKGKFFERSEWNHARNYLGLRRSVAERIIGAADSEGDNSWLYRDSPTRRRLLAACRPEE